MISMAFTCFDLLSSVVSYYDLFMQSSYLRLKWFHTNGMRVRLAWFSAHRFEETPNKRSQTSAVFACQKLHKSWLGAGGTVMFAAGGLLMCYWQTASVAPADVYCHQKWQNAWDLSVDESHLTSIYWYNILWCTNAIIQIVHLPALSIHMVIKHAFNPVF